MVRKYAALWKWLGVRKVKRQMSLSTSVLQMGQRYGIGRGIAVHGVHSQHAFMSILRRERARVGRNSHCFSLVVFRYSGSNGSDAAARDSRFLRLLTEKIRFTDEVGVLKDGEVGVLLPETAVDGARVFGKKVQLETLQWPVSPQFRVHVYPDHAAHSRDDESQPWLDGIKQAVETMSATDQAAAMDGEQPEASGHGAKGGMEHYLRRPLPSWTRAFDIAASLIGLIVFAPVMLAMALLLKVTSPGPILFKQERIGYLGKPFTCLKFRTMHMGSEVSSHRRHLQQLIQSGRAMVKLDARDDPRIIPFGQTIRLAGLDELAQLINVLKGEMSFIGPRPCIPYEYDEYDQWHRMRTESHPGLTGLWQVSGKNTTTFTQMMRYDISYVRNLSLWLDLSIASRTIPAIVKQFSC